jgi:hypothetical protein
MEFRPGAFHAATPPDLREGGHLETAKGKTMRKPRGQTDKINSEERSIALNLTVDEKR